MDFSPSSASISVQDRCIIFVFHHKDSGFVLCLMHNAALSSASHFSSNRNPNKQSHNSNRHHDIIGACLTSWGLYQDAPLNPTPRPSLNCRLVQVTVESIWLCDLSGQHPALWLWNNRISCNGWTDRLTQIEKEAKRRRRRWPLGFKLPSSIFKKIKYFSHYSLM